MTIIEVNTLDKLTILSMDDTTAKADRHISLTNQ